jgi:Ca2+-binding RTX toxin-like protein
MVTQASGIGDNDIIRIRSGGTNFAIGGTGYDDIQIGDGINTVLGDEGVMMLVNGKLDELHSLNPGVGADDKITLGSGTNHVIAGAGNDTVQTGSGFNLVFGDEALVDYADGYLRSAQSMNPQIAGFDTIRTQRGYNTVVGGSGGDDIFTGIGENVIFGDNAALTWSGVHVKTATTTYHTIGSNDFIRSEGGDSLIFGGQGADTIQDGNGNSFIVGDNGNATLTGGLVRTLITTDRGTGAGDTILAGAGNDRVFGGKGDDFIDGGSGKDTLLGDHGSYHRGSGSVREVTLIDERVGGHDTIFGGGDDDMIYGQGGDDYLDGGTGNDSIFAGWGNDFLYGGFGNDVLMGGPGYDFLDGGPGADWLYVDIFDTWVADYADIIIGGPFWSTGLELAFLYGTGRFDNGPGGAFKDAMKALAKLAAGLTGSLEDIQTVLTQSEISNSSSALPTDNTAAAELHYDMVRWGGTGYGYLLLAMPRLLGLVL